MHKKKQYYSTIKIPNNVNIKKIDNVLYFQGPLGKSFIHLKKLDPKGLAGFFIDSNEINKQTLKIITTSKSFYGLSKAIIENKLHGISRGFLIYLKIVGIGYRANLIENTSKSLNKTQIEYNDKHQTLFLKLGYSHDIIYKLPTSIKVFLVDPTLICLFGVEKNQLTQIAAQLRNLRRPSVYKGKGIRFLNEKISLKVGKRK